MRLINTKTLELGEFFTPHIPNYAILSHTWGDEEVTFQDFKDVKRYQRKSGWAKIERACIQAQANGLEYLWVDTNCIDKTSSAELSEAINSMFSYYRNSQVCYAYLSDVDPVPSEADNSPTKGAKLNLSGALQYEQIIEEYQQHFCQSKWFTRGWTLQELLAPTEMTFYARDWSEIANRSTLASLISSATNINPEYLQQHLMGPGPRALSHASAAQKMAWLSSRSTTRVEDMAYCMLGIFDINMPLLYGEGPKAFIRLQEEIIKASNDHTIFCWTWNSSVPNDWVSLLAPNPRVFQHSARYYPSRSSLTVKRNFKMTNAGLSICLPIVQTHSYYLAILNVKSLKGPRESSERYGPQSVKSHMAIPIYGRLEDHEALDDVILQQDSMIRIPFPPNPCFIKPQWSLCQPKLFIRSRRGVLSLDDNPFHFNSIYSRNHTHDKEAETWPLPSGFLLIFDNVHALDEHGTFRRAQAVEDEDVDEHRSRVKPTVSYENIFLLERIPKWRRENLIQTYPPGIFDERRSMVVHKTFSTCSGVLVRLGAVGDECTLFLGLKTSQAPKKTLPFCKVLQPDNKDWLRGPHYRSKLLQEQVHLIKDEEDSSGSDIGHGYSVVINEGHGICSESIFPTFIHQI